MLPFISGKALLYGAGFTVSFIGATVSVVTVSVLMVSGAVVTVSTVVLSAPASPSVLLLPHEASTRPAAKSVGKITFFIILLLIVSFKGIIPVIETFP
jgi:hypothetical protein